MTIAQIAEQWASETGREAEEYESALLSWYAGHSARERRLRTVPGQPMPPLQLVHRDLPLSAELAEACARDLGLPPPRFDASPDAEKPAGRAPEAKPTQGQAAPSRPGMAAGPQGAKAPRTPLPEQTVPERMAAMRMAAQRAAALRDTPQASPGAARGAGPGPHPAYGQAPHGQPQHGQPPHGQAYYGHAPHGQAAPGPQSGGAPGPELAAGARPQDHLASQDHLAASSMDYADDFEQRSWRSSRFWLTAAILVLGGVGLALISRNLLETDSTLESRLAEIEIPRDGEPGLVNPVPAPADATENLASIEPAAGGQTAALPPSTVEVPAGATVDGQASEATVPLEEPEAAADPLTDPQDTGAVEGATDEPSAQPGATGEAAEQPEPAESLAATTAAPEPAQTAERPDRAFVREIQAGLRAAGFDPGPIDGDLGPRTRGAIEEYETASGLQPGSLSLEALALRLEEQPASRTRVAETGAAGAQPQADEAADNLRTIQARAAFNAGLQAADRNDPATAIANYTEALDTGALSTRNRAYALNNRGNAFQQRGQNAEAIVDYTAAIEAAPDYAVAYANRGHAQRALGNLPQAVEDYDQAIALKPQNPTNYLVRGSVFYEMALYPRARADFDQAIELGERSATAFNLRGLARGAEGDFPGAIVDHSEAISLDPGMAKAYADRGVARHNSGEYEAAEADYDQALSLNPDLGYVLLNRAQLRRARGADAEAEQDLQKAMALSAQNPSLASRLRSMGYEP